MNENAKNWVEALRSGEYVQTTGQLCEVEDRDSARYCCLGVACDLALFEVGGRWHGERFVCDGIEYDEVLPDAVREWLGLNEEAGDFISTDEEQFSTQRRLVDVNDNGASFNEIADLIESQPKGLFR